jgi:hypothetical protein
MVNCCIKARRGNTMVAVKDVSRLLANVPKGAWVAISKDRGVARSAAPGQRNRRA